MKQNYSPDIIASLFHAYFPEKEITSCSLCDGGVENSNFLIATAQDRYVLKIFEGSKNHEAVIRAEVDIMMEMKNKGVLIPRIYSTPHGENITTGPEGKWTILMEFIPGEKHRDVPLDEESLFLLGESIAKFDVILHDLTGKYSIPEGHMYNLKYILSHPELRANIPDYADPVIINVVWDEVDGIRGIFLDLPRQIIHNDLHSSNILFKDGNPYFLDFSDLLVSPVIQEVATSLVSWCFHHFWYPEGMALYLKGFEGVRPLSSDEKSILFACIECRMLNILMAPYIPESGLDGVTHAHFLREYHDALVRFHKFGYENFMRFIP